MSKILITGINGQDASYLAEYMIELRHDVCGTIRRHSDSLTQQSRIDDFRNRVTVFYGDMTDATSIEHVLSDVRPDYIFNLAAQSHVRISFDVPVYTCDTNAMGTLKILDAYRRICPNARYYQASSSEMFGLSVDPDNYQRESTPMNPTSPYGVAKVFAYNMTRHYRRAYGLHACNGILFNHESSRRGANFVTQKVVMGAVKIKLGSQDKLELGNMDSFRDWGHSYDYVRAMWLIINHLQPMDFVVATGETHSVREMCETVFGYLNLDYRDYVVQNPKYIRPEELPYLRGDSTKIRTILGWQPTYTFESLMKEMVDYWLKTLDNGKK
jgi:GDPmannose 4,6-dehydratase